jgi:ABC-type sulfate transport system permease subunit
MLAYIWSGTGSGAGAAVGHRGPAFAIPTLVTGVMLVAIYGPNTPIGKAFGSVGIHLMFSQLAVLLALCVVTFPFVVRTVQPVLLELDTAEEEAAQVPRRVGLEDVPSDRDAGDPPGDRRRRAPRLRSRARGVRVDRVRLGQYAARDDDRPLLHLPAHQPVQPDEAAAVATLLFDLVRPRSHHEPSRANRAQGGEGMSVVLGPPRLVDVTPGSEEMRHRGRRRSLVRGAIVAACLLYLTIVLIAPLVGILLGAFREGLPKIGETLTSPDVRHAFFLTFQITVVTLIVTTTLGAVTAWVLVRHRFIGRRIMNAIVELPLAMSPVTVGLACVLLFGRGGWFEPWFTARGIQINFALPSMIPV